MTDAIESPAALRRKADKCENLAGQMSGGDAATLLQMAIEYREMAERLETATPTGDTAEGTLAPA
jgi:hypothetical protein